MSPKAGCHARPMDDTRFTTCTSNYVNCVGTHVATPAAAASIIADRKCVKREQFQAQAACILQTRLIGSQMCSPRSHLAREPADEAKLVEEGCHADQRCEPRQGVPGLAVTCRAACLRAQHINNFSKGLVCASIHKLKGCADLQICIQSPKWQQATLGPMYPACSAARKFLNRQQS